MFLDFVMVVLFHFYFAIYFFLNFKNYKEHDYLIIVALFCYSFFHCLLGTLKGDVAFDFDIYYLRP